MTAVLITQCLQRDFVDPIGPHDPLPNLLHVGYSEAELVLRVDWIESDLIGAGRLGITLCPGRRDRGRDLGTDLASDLPPRPPKSPTGDQARLSSSAQGRGSGRFAALATLPTSQLIIEEQSRSDEVNGGVRDRDGSRLGRRSDNVTGAADGWGPSS